MELNQNILYECPWCGNNNQKLFEKDVQVELNLITHTRKHFDPHITCLKCQSRHYEDIFIKKS